MTGWTVEAALEAVARDAATRHPHWTAPRVAREILPDLLDDVRRAGRGLTVQACNVLARDAAKAAVAGRKGTAT